MIPARDHARPSPPRGGVRWTQTWRDALGRPMASGAAELTPVEVPGVVAATVRVPIVNGSATATIAAGTYDVGGRFVTADGSTVEVPRERITVPEP